MPKASEWIVFIMRSVPPRWTMCTAWEDPICVWAFAGDRRLLSRKKHAKIATSVGRPGDRGVMGSFGPADGRLELERVVRDGETTGDERSEGAAASVERLHT